MAEMRSLNVGVGDEDGTELQHFIPDEDNDPVEHLTQLARREGSPRAGGPTE
jgi:RNA polymerase nonessential primary-like sigma factor